MQNMGGTNHEVAGDFAMARVGGVCNDGRWHMVAMDAFILWQLSCAARQTHAGTQALGC
jgi:hypothetical protein